MNFLISDDSIKDNIAIIDESTNKQISYGELTDLSSEIIKKIYNKNKSLIFLLCDNSSSSIINYLSSVKSGHAVLLLDKELSPVFFDNLRNFYDPEFIISPIELNIDLFSDFNLINNEFGHFVYQNKINSSLSLHKDLAVLLSTSGTTGSPKLVRLSYGNLQANAEAIVNYLSIDSTERPITSLPIHYSYGLSVINSHLIVGATIVCASSSMMSKQFWSTFNKYNCTSFSGVPYNYQILKKLGFEKFELPTLRTMTQAGGKLSEELIKIFHKISIEKKIKFYVMYGQTEATARISYVPPDRLETKIGSIGIPIPGGQLALASDKGVIDENIIEGELVYRGDNVMMGYAENKLDLFKGDNLGGTLFTGDLARKDTEGYFYIVGRKKRFLKVFGVRLNLDEIENIIEREYSIPVACFGEDDQLMIFLETENSVIINLALEFVAKVYNLHYSSYTIKSIKSIVVTTSSKKDYQKMMELFRDE